MSRTQTFLFSVSPLDILIATLIGILSMSLYVHTLAPSLLYGDMAEFQTLSYTLGMTHPSGYPTQIIFGKLFTFLPFGDIAYRANLVSAFFGALAVANVYLVVRLLGGWRTAGLVASSALATSVFFWRRTIIAESYAPAAGMLALVWLSVLLWRRTQDRRWLFVAGLAGGLSLGIHSTVLMTGVSVLAYLLLTTRRRSDWTGAVTGALLGLALTFVFFLYLDYNDPPSSIYNTTYRPNLSERGLTPEEFDTPIDRFLAIFPAGGAGEYYFSAPAQEVRRRLGEYVHSFPGWQFAGLLLGMLSLFFFPKNGQTRWREGLYALIAFLLIWGFAVSVEFSVYQEFYVPASVIAYVWLGVGASTLLDGVEWLLKRWQALRQAQDSALRQAQDSALRQAQGGVQSTSKGVERSGLLTNLFGLALVVLSLWNARADLRLALTEGTTSFIQAEKIYPRDPERATKEGRRILSQVEDKAILFANWDRLYSYVYTAHILEGRTGIALHELLAPPQPGSTTKAYIDANIDTRPVYFTVWVPELEEYYQVEQVDEELWRIRRK